MMVFSHIPRTGGTSLRAFISARVERSRHMDALSDFAFLTDSELRGYDFIATHCGYGVFKRLPGAARLIVLREPVERVVSHYYYLRAVVEEISYGSHYAKSLSLAEFVALLNPAVRIGVENVQTWHLIEDKNIGFRKRYGDLGDVDKVDLAFANLLTFDLVGFHHALDALVADVEKMFPANALAMPRLAASNRPPLDELDSPTLEMIRSRVKLDLMLYQRASQYFQSRQTVVTGNKGE